MEHFEENTRSQMAKAEIKWAGSPETVLYHLPRGHKLNPHGDKKPLHLYISLNANGFLGHYDREGDFILLTFGLGCERTLDWMQMLDLVRKMHRRAMQLYEDNPYIALELEH